MNKKKQEKCDNEEAKKKDEDEQNEKDAVVDVSLSRQPEISPFCEDLSYYVLS